MTAGIHKYLWPIELPDNHLAKSIMRACQALALDEERTTFHPQLWNEATGNAVDGNAAAAAPAAQRYIKEERLSQVWFSGVHTNVGGGYPDDALAFIPFVWMITEAKRCGLKFKSDYEGHPPDDDLMIADPDTFKNAVSRQDKDGRLYDPRKGLAAIIATGRASWCRISTARSKSGKRMRSTSNAPRFMRACSSGSRTTHAYAPVGLPPYYDVVRERDGAIITPDQYGFETTPHAADRAEAQEHVWNEVWKRRILYFATVGATIWLVIFPLVSSAQRADEYYPGYAGYPICCGSSTGSCRNSR